MFNQLTEIYNFIFQLNTSDLYYYIIIRNYRKFIEIIKQSTAFSVISFLFNEFNALVYVKREKHHPNVKIYSKSELRKIQIELNENRFNYHDYSKQMSLVRTTNLQLLKQSAVIEIDSLQQGLLRSIVADFDRWLPHLPVLENSLGKFELFLSNFRLLKNAKNWTQFCWANKSFNKNLSCLLNEENFRDIKLTLFRAQLELLQLILETVKLEQNHLSCDFYENKFRMKNQQILVIVHEQAYPQIEDERILWVYIEDPENSEQNWNKIPPPKVKKSKTTCNLVRSSVKSSKQKVGSVVSSFSFQITNETEQNWTEISDRIENFNIILDSDLNNIIVDLFGNDCKIFESESWNHVNLPDGTFAIAEINNLSQGLLHSFVHHWDNWINHIPNLHSQIHEQLEPIEPQLSNLKKCKSKSNAYEEFISVLQALKRVNAEAHFEVLCTLFIVQLEILQFLQIMTTIGYKLLHDKSSNPNELYLKVNSGINREICVLYLSKATADEESEEKRIDNVYFLEEQKEKDLKNEFFVQLSTSDFSTETKSSTMSNNFEPSVCYLESSKVSRNQKKSIDLSRNQTVKTKTSKPVQPSLKSKVVSIDTSSISQATNSKEIHNFSAPTESGTNTNSSTMLNNSEPIETVAYSESSKISQKTKKSKDSMRNPTVKTATCQPVSPSVNSKEASVVATSSIPQIINPRETLENLNEIHHFSAQTEIGTNINSSTMLNNSEPIETAVHSKSPKISQKPKKSKNSIRNITVKTTCQLVPPLVNSKKVSVVPSCFGAQITNFKKVEQNSNEIYQFNESFKIVSDSDLNSIIIHLFVNDCKFFENDSWNHVSLREGKIVIAEVNNLSKGLMHSFVHHWDQWTKMFPELYSLIRKKLEPIEPQLNNLKKCKSKVNAYEEFVTVLEALKGFNAKVHFKVICALFLVQVEMLHFLQNMTTNGYKFLPDKSSNSNVLYFKVESDSNQEVCILLSSNTANKQSLTQIGQSDTEKSLQNISNVYFI